MLVVPCSLLHVLASRRPPTGEHEYICFILEHHVHRGKSESITIKDEEGHSTHSASMAAETKFHLSVVARILPCMGFGKKTCPNLVPLLNGTTTALSGTRIESIDISYLQTIITYMYRRRGDA